MIAWLVCSNAHVKTKIENMGLLNNRKLADQWIFFGSTRVSGSSQHPAITSTDNAIIDQRIASVGAVSSITPAKKTVTMKLTEPHSLTRP